MTPLLWIAIFVSVAALCGCAYSLRVIRDAQRELNEHMRKLEELGRLQGWWPQA